MVKESQLLQYRDAIVSGKLITMAAADKALGSDVKGYVMPMFSSQTTLAYNPTLGRTHRKAMTNCNSGRQPTQNSSAITALKEALRASAL